MVSPDSLIDSEKKAHPWRRCPMGKHLVKEHTVHIPPSKKHPNGFVSIRHEHCVENRSRKDELSFDEIQYITNTYFFNLTGPPTPHNDIEPKRTIKTAHGLMQITNKTHRYLRDTKIELGLPGCSHTKTIIKSIS